MTDILLVKKGVRDFVHSKQYKISDETIESLNDVVIFVLGVAMTTAHEEERVILEPTDILKK